MDQGGGDGRGYDAREWITTLEAMPRFGFSNDWSVLRACRRAGIEERRVNNPNGGRMCIFRRSEVEKLLQAREHEAWLKDQGMKKCPTCKEWKDKALEFANRVHDCRPCAKARYKREWARKKKQRRGGRAFLEAWGGDRGEAGEQPQRRPDVHLQAQRGGEAAGRQGARGMAEGPGHEEVTDVQGVEGQGAGVHQQMPRLQALCEGAIQEGMGPEEETAARKPGLLGSVGRRSRPGLGG